MQKYTNNTQDNNGNANSGAQILVTNTSNGNVATLYSDNGVNTASNPLKSDANGMYSFYAANGRYTIAVTNSIGASTTISDIVLFDPADANAVAASKTSADDGASGSLWTTVQGFINKMLSSAAASVLGFLATGVSAVPTNIAQKLQQYQSVFDNMTAAQIADVIAGTAAIDVTAAIQAAHDKLPATGGTIDFPLPGLYLLATDGTYVNITKPNVTVRATSGAVVVSPSSSDPEVKTGTRYLNGFSIYGDRCTVAVNMRGPAISWFPQTANDVLTVRDMRMYNLYVGGINISGTSAFDTLYAKNVIFENSRDLTSDSGNYEMIVRSSASTSPMGKKIVVDGCQFRSVAGALDAQNVKDIVLCGGTRFEGVDVTCFKLATADNTLVNQNITVDETVTFDGAALNPASANRHIACTGLGRAVANYTGNLGFVQVFDVVKFHGKAYNFANYGVQFLDGSRTDAVLNFDGSEFVDCPSAVVDVQGVVSMVGMKLVRSNVYSTSISTVRSVKFNANRMIDSYAAFTKKSVALWSPIEALGNTIDYSIDNLAPLRLVNYGTDSGPAVLFDKNIVNITGAAHTLAIDGGTTGTQAFIGASNIITAAAGTPTTNGFRLTAYEPQTAAGYSGSIDFPYRNGEMTIVNTNSLGSITYLLTAATSTKLPIGTKFKAVKTNNANAFVFSDSVANSINGGFTTVTFGSAYASAVFEKIGTDSWSVTSMSGTVTLT